VPDVAAVQMLSNDRISTVFAATVQATEEAIVNALVGGETMKGAADRTIQALPHETLKALLKKYGR
jgi:L-aminopeptidase/D-esterase-like protein